LSILRRIADLNPFPGVVGAGQLFIGRYDETGRSSRPVDEHVGAGAAGFVRCGVEADAEQRRCATMQLRTNAECLPMPPVETSVYPVQKGAKSQNRLFRGCLFLAGGWAKTGTIAIANFEKPNRFI